MTTISRLILLAVLATMTTFANASDDKPFAEKHAVLQISDDDPDKQTLVLNVASNLIKHYGPDKVEVEIVAFGPGLRLLFKNNANKGRISGLAGDGVRFAACKNTIAGMTKKLGYPPELNEIAVPVSAGVVRIMDLVAEGYTLIRP